MTLRGLLFARVVCWRPPFQARWAANTIKWNEAPVPTCRTWECTPIIMGCGVELVTICRTQRECFACGETRRATQEMSRALCLKFHTLLFHIFDSQGVQKGRRGAETVRVATFFFFLEPSRDQGSATEESAITLQHQLRFEI